MRLIGDGSVRQLYSRTSSYFKPYAPASSGKDDAVDHTHAWPCRPAEIIRLK